MDVLTFFKGPVVFGLFPDRGKGPGSETLPMSARSEPNVQAR